MTPQTFEAVCRVIKDRAGITLSKDKSYLVESRLLPVARRRNLKEVDDLVFALKGKDGETVARDVTEAMTTNESFFFRDITPFETFRNVVLPDIASRRSTQKSLRIWCAAASSGQEPYTIAMILKESAATYPGWRFDIVGTDISSEMIAKAKVGLYSQFEVQRGLPVQLLVKYFKKNGDLWQIDPAIRAMVQYREFNLLQDAKTLGRFDVVFCRNVLIYFDQPTKGSVLARAAAQMPPDGVLFLGGAETVLGISDKFQPIPGHRGIYGVAGAVRAALDVAPARSATAAAS